MRHIKIIRNFFYKNGYLLILAGWLLTLSYLFQYYWSYTSAPAQVKKMLQRSINNRETDFETILSDTALVKQLSNGTYSKADFERLLKKDYFIFVASEGNDGFQTRFWNTQVILPVNELWQRADGVWFEQLINGYYTVYKKQFSFADGSSCFAMALIPVKWNYFVITEDLNNGFAYLSGIEKYYSVSDISKSELEVKSKNGTTLFWLKEKKSFPQPLNHITVLLRLLALFLFLYFLHRSAADIVREQSFFYGATFLVIMLVGLRAVSYFVPLPLNFRQFDLFDPAVYGSNNILKSLGDLFINSFLLLWIIIFIRKYSARELIKVRINHKVGVGIVSVLIVAVTIVFGNVIRSLVADSQISFNVTNFFSLINSFSFAGFVILGCLALNYYLIVERLIMYLKEFSNNKQPLQHLAIAVTGLIYLTITFNSGSVSFHLSLLIWLLIVILLMNEPDADFGFLASSGRNVFWLFFFSLSLTVLLITQNAKKEWEDRMRMAEKLSLQTDPSAENLLSIAFRNLRSDFLNDNFSRFTTPGSNQFLKDSLIGEHFSGYLNKFESDVYTYDAKEAPLYNADSTSFNTLNTIFNLQSKPTSVRDWQYHEESFDKFYYIAKKEVNDTATNQVLGYVFILSRPKRYGDEKFAPQLFSKTFNQLPENTPAYAYAVYKNRELISSFNDYPFPVHLDVLQNEQLSYKKMERNGYSELWYTSANLTVIVAKQQNRLLETITLFAYLFFVFLLMMAAFRLLLFFIKTGFRLSRWKEELQLTFRTQVHTTIIGISILSFLVIGISTIFFFINRHSRNNKERLSRTIRIMQGEVESALKEHAVFDDVLKVYDEVTAGGLQAKVNRISEIHGVDINIYDPAGSLRISSQPYYYNKGLLSRKTDPSAYYKLSREYLIQTIEDEKVGSRSYMSVYAPVRDEAGKTYAYINIPYFTSQNELKQEISSFLVTLINLNAFVFLIAGLIAFFVTGRITNSFSIISEKMKQVKLGMANEEIVWNRNDEIGDLVQQYNKMVKQLEESANLLARSEREGAWREMARQVAHEIKNPLTPMKLSIQYLQKAVDSNSPDTKNISQGVAKTLVEQIDYLSNIASDFSSFANIANPRLEKVDLAQSVKSVVDLFSMDNKGDIIYEPGENVFVMADKTQLNRLFTNLIRNAIESVDNSKTAIIKIGYTVDDEKVVVRIADNGQGIDAELREKIFYPNFTTKTSGTGLGLAMCKSIVENMKGKIWFETEQQKGSTFFVELPVLHD